MFQEGVRPSFATGFAQWPGMSEYPQLWEGLVGAWDFTLGITGNKVFDLSGNNNTGIITNAVWTPYKFGSGLKFDTGDYVTISNSNLINVFDVGKSWTVVLWVNFSATETGWQWVFCKAYTSHDSPYYQVDIRYDETNTRFNCYMHRSDIFAPYLNAVSDAIVLNTWHQVVMVYDASADSLSCYMDGIFNNADTSSAGTYSHYNTNISLGANLNFINASYDFQGKIDNGLIYNRFLSASEIALLHQLMKRLAT